MPLSPLSGAVLIRTARWSLLALLKSTLSDIPESSTLPDIIRQANWDEPAAEAVAALREAGYEGVQGGNAKALAAHGLPARCRAC